MEIPFVGQFIIKGNVAAIAFNQDLLEDTKGVTAKNHFVNKLFASSVNKHNLQLIDNNTLRQNPSAGLGGAIKVTTDAESWLKSNLNINVHELNYNTPSDQKPPRRLMSANPASRQ
jgi:hypothetical protein